MSALLLIYSYDQLVPLFDLRAGIDAVHAALIAYIARTLHPHHCASRIFAISPHRAAA